MRSAITVAGMVGQSSQQLADLRLDGIDQRASALAFVARRGRTPHRSPDGVAGHPQLPGDGLDAQVLGEVAGDGSLPSRPR